MRLRQVALAATELQPARQAFFELLGITKDYQDPGVGEFGLENSVMAIGDTFLEVVAPTQPNTAAGRSLQRIGADACGYMALLQVENFADFEQHLNAIPVRQVWSTKRAEVSACHVHPKDIGGAIVSFDEMRPAEEWVWAGPHWREQQAAAVDRIEGIELGSPDPTALYNKWANVLGVHGQAVVGSTIAGPDKDNLQITFDDGTFVSFTTDTDNEALQQITFATTDPAELYQRAEALGLGGKQQPALGQLQIRFTQA